MLVLSRQENETITITSPEGIVITITAVEILKATEFGVDKRVKLGITAPRDWAILRDDAKSIDRPSSCG